MRKHEHEPRAWRWGALRKTVVVVALVVATPAARAQQPAATQTERARADSALAEMRRLTAEDHRLMLAQLGITALRPGPSGNEQAANHANYDSALANPFTSLPEVLRLNDGRRVTNVRLWQQRRRELIDAFEREVYGRVPAHVPKVTWTVSAMDTGRVGGRRVVAKQLVGHVDNRAYPAISVDIPLTLVVPADVKGRVPVMIMFRPGTLEQALGRPPLPGARPQGFVPPPTAPGSDAPATEQLIVDGWGFVFLNPTSVQADNGAGLTQGIIGLTNHGQRRKPDDWGALRAWAWGASRALDFLATDRAVDATRVGIEGVSRYGKAALVTMAFDPRFAMVLIGSSGKGGATLHRRNWGEAVESLTGSGEYHWMAGNYLAYGADSSPHGRMTANDLSVDSHELIALCAPRLTFVSYGIPEKGDAKWLDQQGSFMATVAAQPVFRLLGAKDMGVPDDWRSARMPPVNTGLLGGELAWRQHDGGHTDAPNWKYFLPWADRHFARSYTPAPPVPAASGSAPAASGATPSASTMSAPASGADVALHWPADKPTPRTDANSMLAHEQLLAKRTQGKIDVYFEGNSITRRWGATDYPAFLANWRANFTGWNAADFGWGADRIEHILWRLEHGELDGVNPKVIVVLAGTNNVGSEPSGEEKIADITRGLRALVDLCRAKAPNATIVLTGIFPRNDKPATAAQINAEIARINENLVHFADGKSIRYVNVNDKLADASGTLRAGMTVDGLHPTLEGYQIWADALKPILTEVLGPPAAKDEAPPATGDPSAKKP
jgi:lysophospholipase L1-like esterase